MRGCARAVLAHARLQLVEVHHACVPVLDGGRFRAPGGGAADVEGAHGELRTRLADRLRGDHAHRLSDVHLPAARQVAAVALDADAAPGLAGEHRADLHLLQAGFLDLTDLVLVDLLVGLEDDLVGEGVFDVVQGHAAEDALAHRLDDLAALHQGAERNPVHGSAVVLGDDGILRYIHQAPREVAGVGRLQRRVGETLAGSVRGDEVLQDGQALAEVRRDGGLDDLAGRLRHQAAHARQLADLLRGAAGAGVGHDEDRVEARLLLLLAVPLHRLRADLAHHLAGHLLGDLRPDVDHLVVPLAVGDQSLEVLVLDLGHFLLRALQLLLLLGRVHHVLDGDGDARLGGVAVPEAAQPVGKEHRLLLSAEAVADVDQVPQRLLVHHLVDGAERDLLGEDVAQEHAADGGLHARAARGLPLGVELVHAAGDLRLQVHLVVVVGRPDLGRRGEHAALAVRQHPLAGEVVEAEHDVLRGHDDRLAVRGAEDVVGAHHQHARLHLRLDGERHVHRHLVAVEVRVEGGAHQRVELDSLALDQHRLEGLDAEAVQRRRAVQEHRVLADHFLEDVPDLGALLLHHLLRALDGGDVPALLELVVDERLEQLEGHDLRQSALVQLQLGAHHDDRSARVVDALAEQVLAETSLLALEHVGERLQGPLVGTGDGLAAAAVVEQRVDRLLQHALLVLDDDVWSVELLQALQAVVAVDHAPVQVVEVGGREPAAVERHQRTQIRRDHRDHVQHHPLGAVSALQEGVDHLQPLRQLLALGVAGRLLHLLAELVGELVDVDLLEQLDHRLAAHPGGEGVLTELFQGLVVLVLGEELAAHEGRLLRVHHHVALAVEDLLQVLERDVEQVADARGEALQEPDVGDRRGQVDVAEPLTPHLGLDHLDAALLADHAAVLHALVLAAVALVVLHRPEDLRAEEPVPLRLEGAIVDRLRLLHLAVRPLADLLRRRQRDADGVEGERILGLLEEIEDVLHVIPLLKVPRSQAAAVPGFFGSAATAAGAFSISSTSRPSDWSSLISTLNDSGSPDSSEYSPLTMLSYIRVRPTTSSDFTVRNSCSEYAAP